MREAKSVYIQKLFFFNFGNQLSDEVYNLEEQTVFKIKKNQREILYKNRSRANMDLNQI